MKNTQIYSVYSRTIEKKFFPIPIERVWATFESYLTTAAEKYEWKVYAFVLMNNHFHLLVETEEHSLSEGMKYLLSITARSITAEANFEHSLWKKKFGRTRIESNVHFLIAKKYIYRNPIKASLCHQVEAYPYSTLNALVGLSGQTIYTKDEQLETHAGKYIAWLNKPSPKEIQEKIKTYLKKKVFKASKKNTLWVYQDPL